MTNNAIGYTTLKTTREEARAALVAIVCLFCGHAPQIKKTKKKKKEKKEERKKNAHAAFRSAGNKKRQSIVEKFISKGLDILDGSEPRWIR